MLPITDEQKTAIQQETRDEIGRIFKTDEQKAAIHKEMWNEIGRVLKTWGAIFGISSVAALAGLTWYSVNTSVENIAKATLDGITEDVNRQLDDLTKNIEGISSDLDEQLDEINTRFDGQIDRSNDQLGVFLASVISQSADALKTSGEVQQAADSASIELAALRETIDELEIESTETISQAKVTLASLELELTRIEEFRKTLEDELPSNDESVIRAIFGPLPNNVIAISATRNEEVSYETTVEGEHGGIFSLYFHRALSDSLADSNENGRVSLAEAMAATKAAMQENPLGERQTPAIYGMGSNLELLSLVPITTTNDLPIGEIKALLIGVDQYMDRQGSGGARSDVLRLQRLLNDPEKRLAHNIDIRTRIDADATLETIEQDIEWLKTGAGVRDVLIFYFAGQATWTPTNSTLSSEEGKKVIYLYDYSLSETESFKGLAEWVEELSGVPSTIVIIIDA